MNQHLKGLLWAVTFAVGGSTLSWADMSAKDVLNDLHASNQKEIRMGTLAQNKGSTPEARDYGKTLVSDHQDNDKQVVDIATKQGIALKAEDVGLMEKMMPDKLESLSGKEFDQTFAKDMVEDHQKDISKMQSAQKSQLPADVQKLVGDTMPTLQKHLQLAQKLAAQPS